MNEIVCTDFFNSLLIRVIRGRVLTFLIRFNDIDKKKSHSHGKENNSEKNVPFEENAAIKSVFDHAHGWTFQSEF